MPAPRRSTTANARRSRAASIRLSDEIFETIRNDIIGSRLRPGEQVTESELARRYGFGKTPLRKALVQLTECELVKPLPRSGYQIAPITLKAINSVFDVRMLLEPAAARKAAGHLPESVIKELKRHDVVCQAGCRLGDRKNEDAYLNANAMLHLLVTSVTGNKMLERFHRQVLGETSRIFHLVMSLRGNSREFHHSHMDLISALESGDAETAERLSTEEIQAARRVFINTILSSPKVQDLDILAG